jgi:lipid II:glycine glycyltransferase (peptidoglycan interpeptide bridge formation enzyme)
MREVTQDVYAARMNELLQETFSRTGGHVPERDWSARIKLSADHPDISRIIGLFRTDVEGPESLIAYAWGCHSGDHVYYSEAASTRETGDIKVPMAYALMWDLILWSKRTGADWFDMGGVTRGTHEGDDPLGGISDFKRYFSKEIVRVREEWILDDHTWLASVAATIHKRLRG